MTVKGKLKEAAGFVKEEVFEHGDTTEAQKKSTGRPRPSQ